MPDKDSRGCLSETSRPVQKDCQPANISTFKNRWMMTGSACSTNAGPKKAADDSGGKDKRRYSIPMMTARQYEESLRKLKLEVYMFGKRIENVVDDPIIRPSMNAVAATYELAQRPECAELMTAVSHLTGKRINRFCHIHQKPGRSGEEKQNGTDAGRSYGLLLPALRGNGRAQRPVHRHV